MKETDQKHDNLSFLNSDEREFVEFASMAMELELDRMPKKLLENDPEEIARYDDLKQKIYELKHLDEFKYTFIRNEQGEIHGLSIKELNEEY